MSATPSPARRGQIDGLRVVMAMIALMWVVEVIDALDSHRLDQYGIKPRDAEGLVGIVTAPVLHVSFDHLIANTIPLVFLGLALALGGAARVLVVTAIVVVVGGLGTWLIAPAHSVTVGASGLVFGFATYLMARGAFSRNLLNLGIGLVVAVVWGGVLLSTLVPHDGISWQGHLCGGLAGVLAAWILRGPRPRRTPAPASA